MVPTPMVYTLMPYAAAVAAAVRGSMRPLLFSPSVRSRTTFDWSGARRSRFTAMASPLPMAVPSSRLPILRSITACSTTGVIEGHRHLRERLAREGDEADAVGASARG